MANNIGYHTRLNNNNTVKVVGGSFGGQIDQQTIERLVNAHFSVIIKPSGSACFVDKNNNEVSLYLTVDPLTTQKGRDALKDFKAKQAIKQKLEEEKERKINNLMLSMTNDEILEKLLK